MKRYFTTSEIAKLFKLNRQTLHFYDKKDIFLPEHRDPETGYRSYAFNQVANLALIRYLRNLNFSIEDIKHIMNSEDLNKTIEKLKEQSKNLRAQYNELLETDTAIQRKIRFVEDKLNDLEIGNPELRVSKRIAYKHLGSEDMLYSNKTFYFFPTIAFYKYDKGLRKYNRTFGAYLEPDIVLEEKDKNVNYIEENEALCFYYKGPYKEILNEVAVIKEKYKDLDLSLDFFCINIVDQFLEKETDKFITEIQIPINCKQ